MKVVGVDEARASLAEVLAAAQGEPVCITRHGKPLAVVTGVEGAELAQLFAAEHEAFRPWSRPKPKLVRAGRR